MAPVEIRRCLARGQRDRGWVGEARCRRAEQPRRWVAPSQRQIRTRHMPLPASLAHLNRRMSEKKWKEALQWSHPRILEESRFATKRISDPVPAKAPKTHCSVLPTEIGHALTAAHMNWIKLREDDQCWWCYRTMQTREHLFKHCASRFDFPSSQQRVERVLVRRCRG